MKDKRMKIDIELHVVGDGRTFLNFWNYMNGDDVVVEIKDGKLLDKHNEDKEISLQEFIDRVKDRVIQWEDKKLK